MVHSAHAHQHICPARSVQSSRNKLTTAVLRRGLRAELRHLRIQGTSAVPVCRGHLEGIRADVLSDPDKREVTSLLAQDSNFATGRFRAALLLLLIQRDNGRNTSHADRSRTLQPLKARTRSKSRRPGGKGRSGTGRGKRAPDR
eukprot:scaffold1018_cov420-Prasinococcus_capsulatus_cf.AAC.3